MTLLVSAGAPWLRQHSDELRTFWARRSLLDSDRESERSCCHGYECQADDGSCERSGATDHIGTGTRNDCEGQYAGGRRARQPRAQLGDEPDPRVQGALPVYLIVAAILGVQHAVPVT